MMIFSSSLSISQAKNYHSFPPTFTLGLSMPSNLSLFLSLSLSRLHYTFSYLHSKL